MVVICLEGIDGVGKSTIANQLVEKYEDRIDGFIHFPTEEGKQELEILNETIVSGDSYRGHDVSKYRLLYHAMRYLIFFEDFRQAQYRYNHVLPKYVYRIKKDKREEYHKETLFILDRYYLSNIFYYRYAFRYLAQKDPESVYNSSSYLWHPDNMPDCYFLNATIDLVILITSDRYISKSDSVFTRGQLLELQQDFYKSKLIGTKIPWFGNRIKESVTVEGLQSDSFEKTESLLKRRGFI